MGKIVSLDQVPELIVLDNINEENSLNLKMSDVLFGAPLSLNDDIQANTRVTISASNDNGVYYGDKTFNYNRLNLDLLFNSQVAVVTGPIHDNITAVELLNPEFSLQIDSSNTYLSTVGSDGIVTVMIQDHLVYQPNTQVKVIDEFDFNLSIFRQLIHTNLASASEPTV